MKQLLAELALASAMFGGNLPAYKEDISTVRVNNYENFFFEHDGRKYTIQAFSELAAKEKFERIIKRKNKAQLGK